METKARSPSGLEQSLMQRTVVRCCFPWGSFQKPPPSSYSLSSFPTVICVDCPRQESTALLSTDGDFTVPSDRTVQVKHPGQPQGRRKLFCMHAQLAAGQEFEVSVAIMNHVPPEKRQCWPSVARSLQTPTRGARESGLLSKHCPVSIRPVAFPWDSLYHLPFLLSHIIWLNPEGRRFQHRAANPISLWEDRPEALRHSFF